MEIMNEMQIRNFHSVKSFTEENERMMDSRIRKLLVLYSYAGYIWRVGNQSENREMPDYTDLSKFMAWKENDDRTGSASIEITFHDWIPTIKYVRSSIKGAGREMISKVEYLFPAVKLQRIARAFRFWNKLINSLNTNADGKFWDDGEYLIVPVKWSYFANKNYELFARLIEPETYVNPKLHKFNDFEIMDREMKTYLRIKVMGARGRDEYFIVNEMKGSNEGIISLIDRLWRDFILDEDASMRARLRAIRFAGNAGAGQHEFHEISTFFQDKGLEIKIIMGAE
jgi:hypothetical protein